MKNRLQKFMQAEGLSASRLADMLDIQPSNVSHILSGRNKPGYDFLTKILSRFPKLNSDWLLLGIGSMYRRTDAGKDVSSVSLADSSPDSDVNSVDSGTADSGRSDESVGEPSGNPECEGASMAPSSAFVVPPPASEAAGRKPGADVSQVIVLYEDGTFTAYRQR